MGQHWKDRLLVFCLAAGLCLLWYVPEQIALRGSPTGAGSQLWAVAAREAPILHGFSKLALSNLVRVFIPLLFAFWALLPALIVSRRSQFGTLLWIWLLPGLAFFALVYISDATYLCFLLPVIFLLALARRPGTLLCVSLSLCFVWNALFFSLARPVENTSHLAVAVYSVSGARYCAWALKHQWYRTLRTYTAVPSISSSHGSTGKRNFSASRMR